MPLGARQFTLPLASDACREASPGKLGAFEDELFRNSDMADVPVVMAVALNYVEGHRTIGIAFADTARRQLGACEFTDDEHFCNLELAVVQLGARECMLAKVRPITTISSACELAIQLSIAVGA